MSYIELKWHRAQPSREGLWIEELSANKNRVNRPRGRIVRPDDMVSAVCLDRIAPIRCNSVANGEDTRPDWMCSISALCNFSTLWISGRTATACSLKSLLKRPSKFLGACGNIEFILPSITRPVRSLAAYSFADFLAITGRLTSMPKTDPVFGSFSGEGRLLSAPRPLRTAPPPLPPCTPYLLP